MRITVSFFWIDDYWNCRFHIYEYLKITYVVCIRLKIFPNIYQHGLVWKWLGPIGTQPPWLTNWLWFVVMFLINPRCSMYGIFTYIWAIFGVNVGKYSIHGAYGNYMRVSIVMGVHLYRWMVYFMDHPLQIDDLGVPHFRKPPLVGGFNPFEKYESQLGVWNSQYMEK